MGNSKSSQFNLLDFRENFEKNSPNMQFKLTDFRENFEKSSPIVRSKIEDLYGKSDKDKNRNVTNNPFLTKSGGLVNEHIDYEKLINNPNVSTAAKQYILEAFGITAPEEQAQIVSPQQSKAQTTATGTGEMSNKVGQRVANTQSYNNNAALGQCVWYVRGRASEKTGIDPGSLGNANQMWYNAKADAKLAATTANLGPNMILSYQHGTSSAGQKYGHVIFIEDVVGDTVYYTEGGSGYYKNGTDGVVKTATREQILNGTNSNGARVGSGAIGLIDLSKY